MIVAGVVLLVVVVVVGLKLQSVKGPVSVDAAASREITQHRGAGGAAVVQGSRAAVTLGDEIPVLLGTAALVLWAAFRRDVRGAVVAVVGPSVAIFLTEYVLKPLIDRQNIDGQLTYPSGHVAAVVAVSATALLLVYRYAGPWLAVLWSPVALAATAAIAFAVVVLRWHYLTDSLAGIALGAGVVLVAAGLADTVAPRRRATSLSPTFFERRLDQ